MSFAVASAETQMRGIPPGRLSDAAPTSPLADISQFGVRRYFGRDETIFGNGAAASHVYRVISGTVRLCRYVSSGRRFVVDFAFPSELIGLTNKSRFSYEAEAVGDCVLVAYPRAQLDAVIAGTPSMGASILSQMMDTAFTAQQHALSIGCQEARERVASFLLRMTDRNGVEENETLHLPMKRRDIADHLALCTETTCRVLSSLRAKDIIATPNTHDVVIKNMAALRALGSPDCNGRAHA